MKTSRGPGRVSLPRALSKLGFASRSQAVGLVLSGAVKVDGSVERNPHRWVVLERQKIEVNERTVERESCRCLMLNKPTGIVTTRADERGRTTVFQLLGDHGRGLIAVGRLDKDSTGLLLFTNDHRLANDLTRPESDLPKTYIVEVDRPFRRQDLGRLTAGMVLQVDGKDVRVKPAAAKILQERRIEVSITEGKNRQVRRMLAELGYEVQSLRRIAIGPLGIGDLAEGAFRDLNAEEIRQLRRSMGPQKVTDSRPTSQIARPRRFPLGKRRFQDN